MSLGDPKEVLGRPIAEARRDRTPKARTICRVFAQFWYIYTREHSTPKNMFPYFCWFSQSWSELASGSFGRVLLASSPYLHQLGKFRVLVCYIVGIAAHCGVVHLLLWDDQYSDICKASNLATFKILTSRTKGMKSPKIHIFTYLKIM
jgi:hypothetical protein